jgi:RNA polymerase sigma-70 factor (ECF subfamily)
VNVEALPSVVPSGPARAARSLASSNSAPDSSLAEEIRLLRTANDASRALNHAGALFLVEEHERRFPRGFLTDERRVQKILVLCDLGRKDQARSEARKFTADHPSSPLNARLSSSCAREEGRQ